MNKPKFRKTSIGVDPEDFGRNRKVLFIATANETANETAQFVDCDALYYAFNGQRRERLPRCAGCRLPLATSVRITIPALGGTVNCECWLYGLPVEGLPEEL